MLDLNENIHRRQNPLTGDWVLVSPYRFKRPWEGKIEITNNVVLEYDSNCDLCPGNKRAGGKLNPNYSNTFVFQNDFTAIIEVNEKQPLIRSSNIKKLMVGYELLAESQRDLTPEQSAKKLREQTVKHYSQLS